MSTVFEDVLWNLDTLAELQPNQTLRVDGDRIMLDDRYMQCMRRPITYDGRKKIIQTLGKTLDILDELLKSYDLNRYIGSPHSLTTEQQDIVDCIYRQLQCLLDRQERVHRGFLTLTSFERYVGDMTVRIELHRFSERLTNLCEKANAIMSLLGPEDS